MVSKHSCGSNLSVLCYFKKQNFSRTYLKTLCNDYVLQTYYFEEKLHGVKEFFKNTIVRIYSHVDIITKGVIRAGVFNPLPLSGVQWVFLIAR